MVAVVMLLLPAAASAQGADTTCSFALTRLDATTTNALAVDTNAVYWGGTYAALPGPRIRVEGQYPHARYISWNVYDAAARPIDALADVELAPDPGSSNPFLPGADRTVTDRSYTALHRGRPEAGAARAQHSLHRRFARGHVPLPRLCARRGPRPEGRRPAATGDAGACRRYRPGVHGGRVP
jgi:hypothetical protein